MNSPLRIDSIQVDATFERISYKIIYMTKYRAEGNIGAERGGRVTHLLSADISASRYVRKTISLTSWSRGRIGICGVNRKASPPRLYHGVLSHGTRRTKIPLGLPLCRPPPAGRGDGEKESSRLDFPFRRIPNLDGGSSWRFSGRREDIHGASGRTSRCRFVAKFSDARESR